MQFVTFHIERSESDLKHADSDSAAIDARAYLQMIDMMFDSAARYHADMDPVILSCPGTELGALRWKAQRHDGPAEAESIMLDRTLAQLRHLERCRFDQPIVMLDSDILLFGSLQPLFDEDFDVAVTWRRHPSMPINNGIILLNHRNPATVRRFFRRYAEIYQRSYSQHAAWYGDQMAMAELIGLQPDQYAAQGFADVEGCRVRLLPCSVYNAKPDAKPVNMLWPTRRRRVLHFKGPRKPLMFDYWRLHFSGNRWSSGWLARPLRLAWILCEQRIQAHPRA